MYMYFPKGALININLNFREDQWRAANMLCNSSHLTALRSASSARQRGIFGSCVPVPLIGEERGLQQNLGQGISFFSPKIGARRRSRGGMLEGSEESP